MESKTTRQKVRLGTGGGGCPVLSPSSLQCRTVPQSPSAPPNIPGLSNARGRSGTEQEVEPRSMKTTQSWRHPSAQQQQQQQSIFALDGSEPPLPPPVPRPSVYLQSHRSRRGGWGCRELRPPRCLAGSQDALTASPPERGSGAARER